MAVLKVSSRSNPNAVAGAFAGVIRDEGAVSCHVVGAGALNQAIKAVAIARGFLAEQNLDLVCQPSFTEIDIDGDVRTGILLEVFSETLDGDDPDDLRVEENGYRPAPAGA